MGLPHTYLTLTSYVPHTYLNLPHTCLSMCPKSCIMDIPVSSCVALCPLWLVDGRKEKMCLSGSHSHVPSKHHSTFCKPCAAVALASQRRGGRSSHCTRWL